MNLMLTLTISAWFLLPLGALAADGPDSAVKEFLSPLARSGPGGIEESRASMAASPVSKDSERRAELSELMSSGKRVTGAEATSSEQVLGDRIIKTRYSVSFSNGETKDIEVKFFKGSNGEYKVTDFSVIKSP